MPGFRYYGPARTRSDALDRFRSFRGYAAVDTETVALKGNKSVIYEDEAVDLDAKTCIGIGVAISPDEAFYFPLMIVPGIDSPTDCLIDLLHFLDNPGVTKVFFNSMFDLEVIELATGISVSEFEDVAVAAQCQGLPNSLDDCCGKLFGEQHQVISEVLPKGKTMLAVEFAVTSNKCIHDCIDTLRLFRMMKLDEWKNLSYLGWYDLWDNHYDVNWRIQDCYSVDLKVIPILRKMSKRGVKLDQEKLYEWYVRLRNEVLRCEDIANQEGLMISSAQQVGITLAERGNWIPWTKPKRGEPQKYKHYSVTDDVLAELEDPLAATVRDWRKASKLLNTYIEPAMGRPLKKGRKSPPRTDWEPLDRFHTHFRLDLATGRTASYDRNVQNIPDAVRDIFDADTGIFSWWDFSQLEMRIFAHMGHDSVMLQAYDSGASIHEITLQELWGEKKKLPNGVENENYKKAKEFNFAMIFDADARTLAKNAGCDLETAQEFKTLWLEKYHEGDTEMRHRAEEAMNRGWSETEFGRRPRITFDLGEDHANKCGRNYPIQGTGADVLKRAILICDAAGLDAPLQVHDEFVADGFVDFPRAIQFIHGEMQTPFDVKRDFKWR